LPPGLCVQVIDGLISVGNKGGAQGFAPGQFGFTPSPSFGLPATNLASGGPSRPGGVDREVR
jgi:hypothetical protein